jgi:hypothetical protein
MDNSKSSDIRFLATGVSVSLFKKVTEQYLSSKYTEYSLNKVISFSRESSDCVVATWMQKCPLNFGEQRELAARLGKLSEASIILNPDVNIMTLEVGDALVTIHELEAVILGFMGTSLSMQVHEGIISVSTVDAKTLEISWPREYVLSILEENQLKTRLEKLVEEKRNS